MPTDPIPHVLLIENDKEKADAVSIALTKMGYQVTLVSSNGLSLLKEVESCQPDLIIMDVESPNRDLIESLNQVSRFSPKPVVMFTDRDDKDTINSFVKSGVSTYIVGDIDPIRVRSIIDVAIARFEEYQAVKKELASAKQKLSSQKTVDTAKIWLMENKDLSEQQAYHAIRKMAMDNGQKIEDVARNILSLASMTSKK